jgi:hypothetical protein
MEFPENGLSFALSFDNKTPFYIISVMDRPLNSKFE